MKQKIQKKFYIRFVKLEDCKFLFDLRNDETTRKYAFNSEELNYEEHKKWFQKSLKDPNRTILIMCDEHHKKIGQIRFDKDLKNKSAEIDIAISPKQRGKGYGILLLKKSCEIFFNNFDINTLIAKIKKENIDSINSFTNAGFILLKEHKDFVELTLNRESK